MDAKLNRPLQQLHDQVKGLGEVRSSISTLCEMYCNLLLEAKDSPERVESLALQLGVNAAEWANACVQNTAAVVQERRVSAGQVC